MASMTKPWRVDVVRHAHAHDRAAWIGTNDSGRPLTAKGRHQADGLVALLAPRPATLVVSSPAVRCRETVEPLARALNVDVAIDYRCAEGQPYTEILERITNEGADLVLCSHGDVIGSLIHHFVDLGLTPPDASIRKASTWRLECVAGAVVSATYIPPPT